MSSLNKCEIIGRLGSDPELNDTSAGPVARLSVATDDQKGRTTWHRVTVFGKSAEACARFLSKGRQVYVEGRMEHRTYEKDGVTHRAFSIVAGRVLFLGGGSDRRNEVEKPDEPYAVDDADIPF